MTVSDPTAAEIWRALVDVYQPVLRDVVTELERDAGIDSGTYSVLAYLDRAGGTMRLAELQSLMRDRRPRVVAKGHRHRPAIWAVGGLTLVDAGSLLDECETCAVIVDDCAGTITPLGIGTGGVYAGGPGCRFETG